jgi:hypothetical protein
MRMKNSQIFITNCIKLVVVPVQLCKLIAVSSEGHISTKHEKGLGMPSSASTTEVTRTLNRQAIYEKKQVVPVPEIETP